MYFDLLRDVVLGQRREWERRLAEPFVERDIPRAFYRSRDLIRVIVGPRRAGKSFFALHHLGREGRCGYLNFDDERLVGLENNDVLLAAVDHVYGRPETLLLDEVQNLPRWELFVNRLHREGRRLVITGSNSKLLSRELASHLTGRYAQVAIMPFSFAETLRIQRGPLTAAEASALWFRYLEEGGYPEPLLKSVERYDYLRTLADAVLYRDIVQRYRVRQIGGLEALGRYLFSNVAKEFSYQAGARLIGARSVTTVQKFVGYLEEAFLVFSIPRFSFKVRRQTSYNKKVYAVDNGMAIAMGFRFSEDAGRLAENAVAAQLWREVWNRGWELYFWKSEQGEEVDFVLKADRSVRELIQVCWRMDEEKVRDREFRALVKAGQALRCGELRVLTAGEQGEETVSWYGAKGTVQIMPVWKWLISRGTEPA